MSNFKVFFFFFFLLLMRNGKTMGFLSSNYLLCEEGKVNIWIKIRR